MTTEAERLLVDIARCPNVAACLGSGSEGHACWQIVLHQGVSQVAAFQVPEPWSGDLTHAPILFVSSNPSWDPGEDYPHAGWPDELIIDFFMNRFGNGRKEWVKDGVRPLLSNGEHPTGWVRFWAAARSRSTELLGRPACPGVDFALTEVVHCKSTKEIGVDDATAKCSDQWLLRVLSCAGASLIVTLGKPASKTVRSVLQLDPVGKVVGPSMMAGKTRMLISLPHPNAWVAKTVASLEAADRLKATQFLRRSTGD